MDETQPRIVPQKEFNSLDDFMKNSNNFYLHFMEDCWIGKDLYRKQAHFKRFQEVYPAIERETTQLVVSDARDKTITHKRLLEGKETWEKLFGAYKIMSQLVYEGDPSTIRRDTGKPDDWFLCR